MTILKTVYRASSLGGCQLATAAPHLGYEPVSAPEFMELAATEGRRHERWIDEDLAKEGYALEPPQRCERCGRDGIHVELTLPTFVIVGHADRVGRNKDGERCVLEYKALSRFRAEKLIRTVQIADSKAFLHEFPEYAMQLAVYRFALGFPIVLAVKNRDTGAIVTLNPWGLGAPVSLEEIVDWVTEIEVHVRRKELPPCSRPFDDFHLRWGPYRYLCQKTAAEGPESPQEGCADDEAVRQAAERYIAALETQEEAERQMQEAKAVFLAALKQDGKKELVVGSLTAMLVAESRQTSYPVALLRRHVADDLLAKCAKVATVREHVRVNVE